MRKIWDIHGGIHPLENKSQSLQHPIKLAPIAKQLILPLSQHIGAPAKPVVAAGEKVLKGQVVAKANGFVSVPVHAPTSGTIAAIEDRPIPHASGMTAPCIILDSDHEDRWIEHQGVADYTQLNKAELCNLIREAGISGMGGAGFPSAVKLNTRDDQPIETLIINGTECEPYITADDVLMRERSEEIIAGVKILQHIIQPSHETLIGVEDNKPEAIAALRKAAQGSNIEIVSFPTKYPSGGEKQLIKILTGKEVPSGQLPASIGIVLQNVGTTVAIHNAISKGEPLISRITTVTGNAVKAPQNYEVLIGTPMAHLLELSEFKADKATRLIMGGPMMGFAMHSEVIPVVKTSNCILVPDKKEMPAQEHSQACIRCGMCAQACPVSLLPQQLYWFAQGKEYDKLEAHNLADCIECGACSYSCPSNIPLVQYYRSSKAAIRQKADEARKSDHAKMRFDARQDRLAKAEAEKEAKRQARQAAAKAAAEKKAKAAEAAGSDPKADDPVAAAVARAKAKAGQSSDPVQAAIDRAKAKAAGQPLAEQDPLEKAQQQVKTLEKRLASTEEKLKTAQEQGSDKVDAFASAVEKTQAKLDSAKAELSKLEAQSKASAATDKDKEAEPDLAAAAIARAQAKRDNPGSSDPKAKLEAEIASLQKRIEKAQQKLAAADEDKKEVLQSGLDKQQAKLNQAQEKLAALLDNHKSNGKNKDENKDKPNAESNNTAANSDNSGDDDSKKEDNVANDLASDAIARALAKRAGTAGDQDPKAKLQQDIQNLEKRLANAKSKLKEAQESGSDKVDILSSSVTKLEDKLAKAQQEFNDLA